MVVGRGKHFCVSLNGHAIFALLLNAKHNLLLKKEVSAGWS
jgi:hypothetical protein